MDGRVNSPWHLPGFLKPRCASLAPPKKLDSLRYLMHSQWPRTNVHTALHFMNPSVMKHASEGRGTGYPGLGRLSTEETQQHPMQAPSPWAAPPDSRGRTAFLGCSLNSCHSVTQEHPATPMHLSVSSLTPFVPPSFS